MEKKKEIITLGYYMKSKHNASRVVSGGGYCSNCYGKSWNSYGCSDMEKETTFVERKIIEILDKTGGGIAENV